MRYAKYVGRVGGLAVALGVGLGVGPVSGLALAQDTDSRSEQSSQGTDATSESAKERESGTGGTNANSSNTITPTKSDLNDGQTSTAIETEETSVDDDGVGDSNDDTDLDAGDIESPSDVPGEDGDEQTIEDDDVVENTSNRDGHVSDEIIGASNDLGSLSSDQADNAPTRIPKIASRSTPSALAAAFEADTEVANRFATRNFARQNFAIAERDRTSLSDPEATPPTLTALVSPDPVPTPAPGASHTVDIISGLLSWMGLGPSATDNPTAPPATNPLAWGLLAWTRRQAQGFVSDIVRSLFPPPPQTSEILTTANSAAVAPAVPPSVGDPDPITGTITGDLNVADPDGQPITYTVTQEPTSGALTVNPDGTFIYTPTQLARVTAGATLPSDYDSFTVRASVGSSYVDVPVSVEIYSGTLATNTQTVPVGAGPTAMATFGDRLFVANTVGKSISVIDTRTGGLVASLPVGVAPTDLVVSPDGSRLYVASRVGNAVAAFNTASGAPVAVIPVSAPQSLALNGAGTRLYVTNGTNRVTVLNTVTGATVASITVQNNPTGIAINDAGTRVYVANRGSGTVSVINASTNKVIKTVSVGSMPQQVALSADGTKLLVTNAGSDNVSVVDTATNTLVKNIAVGPSPNGIALGGDGSLAYVVNANHTVSVIDTVTDTRMTGTIQAETGPQGQALVSADSQTLYVSNSVGLTLRTVTLVHLPDPPPPTANPQAGPMFENFNGPAGSLPDPAILAPELSAGRYQFNTASPENVSLDGNGNLLLTVREETISLPPYGSWDYTSAWLTTQDRFEFTYGTLSARMKIPAEKGLHTTFFLVGSDINDVGWPASGEIDIFEVANDYIHSGQSIRGPGAYMVNTQAPFDATGEFHEFWVRWEPDKITMGIDDTVTAVYTPDSLPPGTPWTFKDRSMYAIIATSVGGTGIGLPDETTELPSTTVIDWIRYEPLQPDAAVQT